MIVTWLSYLTNHNKTRRMENYLQSLKSLSTLANSTAEVVIIDNSEPGNFLAQQLRDKHQLPFKIFKADNVFCDVISHYVASALATQHSDKFFAYLYDDFVIYDKDFVGPSVAFMEKNPEVACIRLPKYEAEKSYVYNTAYTSKHENPDSVGHFSAPFNSKVVHDGPFYIGSYHFYKSNWRAISRPTLWRNTAFKEFIGVPSPCPTLQEFERYMNGRIDEKSKTTPWVSGFIDKGICHTFSQSTSERMKLGSPSPTVDLSKLEEMLACPKRWL